MLTLRYRFETYESKGKLFEQVLSEMVIQRLNERLWGLFIELLQVLATLFEEVDEMAVFEKIVTDDEAWERLKALFSSVNNFDRFGKLTINFIGRIACSAFAGELACEILPSARSLR